MRLKDRVLVCSGWEQATRWHEGERFEQIFEERCDWLKANGMAGHLAVDAGDEALTYDQLDARANQLAHYLTSQGAHPGDRIALLFDQPVHSYIGMLAVMKINAVYVPVDVGFPPDRLSYIVQDAGVRIVLTQSHLCELLAEVSARIVCVDAEATRITALPTHRLTPQEKARPADELCYIIYTSGSTGRPKGVAIRHASICNFVRVAVEVYGIEARDRVYQGMTIAFDFSVEEIWVPLAAGATLIPKPAGSTLLGPELREFLQANHVTALCCVPTLLATLDDDIPGLRFLLVSGEACPQDLIARWHRPDRRFLNVYGPTEATVTATWSVVHPDRPVTLGVPLPTYAAVILDPISEEALPPGEMGEIGIAGIGLASGYINRDDLTERAFIRDFLDIDGNASGKIYRTGDLGRINDDGEIEYHGRIDTQVKIRGYRIELTEIESVLLQIPGIAQAVVNTVESRPGLVELVAYYCLRKDCPGVDLAAVNEHLRGRLPGYMVPVYYEELAFIPMLPSNKADRKSLPPPKGPRIVSSQEAYVGPANDHERILAEELADALGVERVSVESHFFDDLGANSLMMARFCARIREQNDLPTVSMKDVYLNPTVRCLAATLADASPETAEVPQQPQPVRRASDAQYVTCGALQLAVFLGYTYVSAVILVESLTWITEASGVMETYARSMVLGCASFVYFSGAPIVAKWLLVGRWKPGEIPIWSLAYVRFWTVKTLIRANPMVLFVGSPLYSLYLRALGARIGKGVVILSRHVPVCTDLLTVGDHTVIRKDSFFSCYRAHAGLIQAGRVHIGRDAYIGEKTVIDIDTSLGDGAQLGHTSSLQRFQAVPAGEHWHGSPAQVTSVDYRRVGPARCGVARRAAYGTGQLLTPLVLYLPVGLGAIGGIIESLMSTAHLSVTSWTAAGRVLAASVVLYLGPLLTGLVFVVTVPRLLNLALKPGRIYPLYGVHYAVQRLIARMTNIRLYHDLFGDSAYIVTYLRALGYNLHRVEQTGSNFGTELQHESPYLSSVGSGTMVSDALSIMNVEFSDTSFRVGTVSIGERNFLGNNIAFPADARTGDNCLLATKVMIPLDGEVRRDVGLLGSPPFEIPRSVQSDHQFDELRTGDELTRRLAAKKRYNTATIGVFLLVRWLRFAIVTLMAVAAAEHYLQYGVLSVMVASLLILVIGVGYPVLVERLLMRWRRLTPQFCSIYQPYFWWHERLWKLLATPLFPGTPFRNLIWRLLGVRIGRRVFDDGCAIPEKTLVTIGDDCTLNEGTVIQCHSLEDGTFKSDYTVLGAGCTLGVEAFVHYGVTMGRGSVLEADSFLMKGEALEPGTRWQGNPAGETPLAISASSRAIESKAAHATADASREATSIPSTVSAQLGQGDHR